MCPVNCATRQAQAPCPRIKCGFVLVSKTPRESRKGCAGWLLQSSNVYWLDADSMIRFAKIWAWDRLHGLPDETSAPVIEPLAPMI